MADFFLHIYKMYLIPAEGYTNAWVHILSIKKNWWYLHKYVKCT